MSRPDRQEEDAAPPWLLPRALLLVGSLLAANPVVLLALTRNLLFTTAVVLVAMLALQVAYRTASGSPLLPYAVNFVALGSIMLHGEFILQTFLPQYAVPSIYRLENGYYFNRPHLRRTFEDSEYRAVYATNSQGFRVGETADPEKAITTADWVFLGDSFTQGAQVSFGALYTSKLYRSFPDRIILNLGASGLGIAEELALFRERGAALKPSIVFLQISPFNDFMNVEPRSVGMGERLAEHSALWRTTIHRLRYQDPVHLPLGRWTEPFHPDRGSNRRFNIFYRESSPEKERDLAHFRHYLGEFKRVVEAHGARLVVVLIPSREEVVPAALEEVQAAFKIGASELDMRRPNALLEQAGRELGIEIIDLLAALSAYGAAAFFDRDEHLTASGHAVVAEGIRQAIASRISSEVQARVGLFQGERYPRPACGGTVLSYQAPIGGGTEVFTLDLRSGSTRQLTSDGLHKSHPMLSSDCTWLVYTQGESAGMRTEVVLMDVATRSSSVLTSLPRQYGAIPVFSPDDRYVAYASWGDPQNVGTLGNPVILVHHLETGRRKHVTEDRYESWRPAFSPDGRRLVFIAKLGGQFDLYVHDLALGETKQLTATSYDEWDPTFSGSGDEVVYAARKDGNWDLFALRIADGRTIRLTATKGDEWDPVFGASDRSVFFAGEFGSFGSIYEVAVKDPE